MKRPEYLTAMREDAKQLDRFCIPTHYPNGPPGGTPFESFTREAPQQAPARAERAVGTAARAIE
jgi:hypothetical protein